MTELESQDLDAFCSTLASALELSVGRLRAGGRLVADLGLDELSLATLIMTVEEMNPHFAIPDQMAIEDLTLADVHWFACHMTRGHQQDGVPT